MERKPSCIVAYKSPPTKQESLKYRLLLNDIPSIKYIQLYHKTKNISFEFPWGVIIWNNHSASNRKFIWISNVNRAFPFLNNVLRQSEQYSKFVSWPFIELIQWCWISYFASFLSTYHLPSLFELPTLHYTRILSTSYRYYSRTSFARQTNFHKAKHLNKIN